jgi:predicted nucleic acid-binding protein
VTRVLVDTGPLVALCDERDALHARALREVDALRGTLSVCLPVLTEAHFLLAAPHLRSRLSGLFGAGVVELDGPRNPSQVLVRAMRWLERYAEHRPDFADAFLVAWADTERRLSVWSFDREFSSVWRTLGGKKLTLAAR